MTAAQPCKRILLVDDDVATRDALTDALVAEGYEVRGAGDGQEALDLLRTEPPPDLILLDLMMPGLNGWEFRHRQVQDPALRRIPVIVLSAAGAGLEDVADGVADFLHKPVDSGLLLETVRRHCPSPVPPAAR
jgi:CheY-like chemotaxis protein